jgi:hypothetical protein
VGYEGSANGMLGIDEKPSSRFGGLLQSWYRVRASDHLQRGHDELGLRGKLDRHLRSEVKIFNALLLESFASCADAKTRESIRPTFHMPIWSRPPGSGATTSTRFLFGFSTRRTRRSPPSSLK